MSKPQSQNGTPTAGREPFDRKTLDAAQAAVERYTIQPAEIPPHVRDAIEQAWNGESIQLYAMADLSPQLQLAQEWLAVGPTQAAVAHQATPIPAETNGSSAGAQTNAVDVRSFPRASIETVRELPGLSCCVLHILEQPDRPPLATLRYTHRQRRAIENVRFLLEHPEAEAELTLRDRNLVYAEAMAQSVRDAQASVASHRFAVLWRLISYLAPYKTRLVLGMIAALVMTVLQLLPPYLTGIVIDDVIRPFEAGGLTSTKAMQTAGVIVLALGGIYLLREAALWVRLNAMSVLGEFVAADLRRDLYTHLQRLSLSFYSSKQTGSIITRVSSDTDRLWDFVAFGVVDVSLAFIMLIGLSSVLLFKDFTLGLVMVLPVPLLLLLFYQHGKTMKRFFLRAFRKWSAMTEVLSDTIPGMKVVKAFHQEGQETARFNLRNSNALNEFNQIHKVWTRFWPGLMLAMHAMTLLIWFLALPRILNAEPTLTFGTFMAFLLYMGMFFQPIEAIGMITRMLNRATTSALRVFEILDTEPDIVEIENPKRLEPVRGKVVFENVSFAYDKVRPIIHSMSFDVQPGEMIGLVGPSGAGKSTVTNLLVRFYDISSGRILIDGVDLRELDLGHFRQQVGMVLQDPHLFHGSVLNNIRYGHRDASLADVINAAKTANAHEFICKLPHGYDTMVGERGHTLSGGERQRVSIARAVLANPRILILDEATSSVDTETERKIQEALERLIHGRTVFAVAHRLSTLRRADRLFVIEKGRISEMGTHAELLEKEGGVYRKLHSLQQELHEMYAV